VLAALWSDYQRRVERPSVHQSMPPSRYTAQPQSPMAR
jgi:hypothetical protein